jgi:hypothetical protein
MKKHWQKTVPLLIGVILGIIGFSINSVARRYAKTDPSPQRQVATYVPEILSCSKNIRVTNTEIANAGTPDASLMVQVENTTNVGIIAIQIESVNDREAFETTLRTSFDNDQPPTVVIKPHEVGTLIASLNNILAGVPLRIGGVMYEDGTEEGCERGLGTLHQVRDHDKSKKKERPK